MSKVIIGKVGGEEWVGTNDGGVGRLLFKLQESEEVFDNSERLRKENQRLTADMKNAISLMSPSWQHASSKEPDLITRYVTMAESQFKKKNKEIDRLTTIATKHETRADELYEALESLINAVKNNTGNEPSLSCYHKAIDDAVDTLDKSRIGAEKGDGICN
ncbi:coil containing protein [Vibrio phage NF]|uniref:Coil containing protein n=1 Tax=Vibrio phage NF TaxID=2686202 RepID=A0A6B9J561_9CAUD|nr:coil containing protein [Vibrio phage NF]QGZ13264.1 coil containing protein [Vibrio phage NF]